MKAVSQPTHLGSSVMKFVTVALLLCAVASVSHSFCYFKNTTPGTTHCKDDVDDTWHSVGSTWKNSECMRCTCDSCCSTYSIPIKYPEECVNVFDRKACEYIVHKKDDPTQLCPILVVMGK